MKQFGEARGGASCSRYRLRHLGVILRNGESQSVGLHRKPDLPQSAVMDGPMRCFDDAKSNGCDKCRGEPDCRDPKDNPSCTPPQATPEHSHTPWRIKRVEQWCQYASSPMHGSSGAKSKRPRAPPASSWPFVLLRAVRQFFAAELVSSIGDHWPVRGMIRTV